jgi:hypothetical protein
MSAVPAKALGHAHKYERPLITKLFSSFRPKRSEEPEPRVLAEFLGSRFRGNDDQDPGAEMCECRSPEGERKRCPPPRLQAIARAYAAFPFATWTPPPSTSITLLSSLTSA